MVNQKTKIVATLGPSSETPEVIEDLIKTGVNIFRLNLKHNNYDWHADAAGRIRAIAKKLGKNIALMADLQGPELRTADFPEGVDKLQIHQGSEVTFGTRHISGLTNIPFDHLALIKGLGKGDTIFIDDGKIELQVIEIKKDHVRSRVVGGGELGSHKSISVPNAHIDVPTLNTKDKNDIKFAIKQGLEFIAISFVRDARDITTLRKFIKAHNGMQAIVAKIETLKSIHNFDEIVAETDAVMVARGDLGIEIPIERVPRVQKELIRKSREMSKPVIVATQMLLSMVNNAQPSRAEVADIANSVFDKADALMLSEESATGKYPVKAVHTMAKIARYNESAEYDENITYATKSFEEIIIAASIRFSKQRPEHEKGVKGYVVFTESGKSARVLSRFRPPLPIYVFTRHMSTYKQLAMSYGVESFYLELSKDPVKNTKSALRILKRNQLIESNDRLIVIFGNNIGVPESNNTLSIVTVK